MPKIRVPTQRRNGLVLLARVPEKSVSELFDRLSKYPLCVFDHEILSELLRGVKSMDYDEALEITDSVVTMFPALTLTNNGADDFVKKIVSVINAGLAVENCLDERELKKLRSRLLKLLGIRNLALSSKAASVYFENHCNLGSARIITDIRPVFDQGTDKIAAALVLHTLKIEYLSDGEQRDFFVALDDVDLDDLIEKLQRAKRKSLEAKGLLKLNDLACIENKE